MKRMKKKLKSVKEIKREKSMSCSNLTTRSSLSRPYPPRSLLSTVSTSNITEEEHENDAEYSSSSTIQPGGHPELSSVDSSCGPMDASSLASCSFSQSLKENVPPLTPRTDQILKRENQSTSPNSVSSQDYEETSSPRVGTNALVRKWSKRKSDHAIRIFPIEENDNIEAIQGDQKTDSRDEPIEVAPNDYVEGRTDHSRLVEEDAKDFYNGFQKISTIPVALLLIIHSFVMMALIFLLPILCEQKTKPHGQNSTKSSDDPFAQCYVDSFSLLIYCHSLYWLAHLIWDQYLKKRHKEHRISGYLDFYLDIKNIRRAPFYIVSTCNFLLLLAMTLLHDYDTYIRYYYDDFKKVDWIRGLITIECMIIICLLAYYIRKIRKFNQLKMPPDVMCESYMENLRANLAWEMDPKNKNQNSGDKTPEEVKEWDRKVKEALNKHQQIVAKKLNPRNQHVHILQAELINFLIQQIKHKNKKLVNLIQQVSDISNIVECNVGNGSEVIVC